MAGYPFTEGVFALEQCTLMLNGSQITGFGSGDVIGFEPYGDILDSSNGADGKPEVHTTNEVRVKCNIVLMAQSGAVFAIETLKTAQRIAPVGIPPVALYFQDPNSGTTVQGNAYFRNTPKLAFGQKFGDLAYELILPTAQYPGNTVVGAGNLIP